MSPWSPESGKTLTTTMSMRPTHIALLQMPVVQVESVWPAGVQNEIRTDAAESSAGSTTTHEVSIDVGLERPQLHTNITIREFISILSIK
jgi:hypothetical protein